MERQCSFSHSSTIGWPTCSDDGLQISFFQLDDPVLEWMRKEILKTDIDTLTPLEALMTLHGINKVFTGGRRSWLSTCRKLTIWMRTH
jgi:hypothetical protein